MDQAKHDSSMEELSPEELRMLTSTKRQEPQGEEYGCSHGTPTTSTQPGKSSNQLLESSGMDMISSGSSSSSPYSSEAEDNGGGRVLDEPRSPTRHPHQHQQHPHRTGKKFSQHPQHYYPRGQQGTNPNNISTDSSNSHSAYDTLIIHQNNSSLLADTWIPATHEFASYGIGNRKSRMDEEEFGPRPTHSYSNPYENMTMEDFESGNNNALTSSELSEIPRDYLNQLTVLKHLAKEVKQDPNGGTTGTSLLRSASFSKSQPDLTQTGQYGIGRTFVGPDETNYAKSQPPAGPSRKSKKHAANNNGGGNESSSSKTVPCQTQAVPQEQQQQQRQQQRHHDDVLPSVQILEILMRENAALNAELVNARRKIATIHKLESELDRLQASHEALFASAERRESLERTARAKLSTELKRLTAVNRELLSSGSLQNLSRSPHTFSTPDIELLKKEIAKRDFTITQLLSQNKELGATKERQDIELSAQRATLAEQRTHIDILDSALTNAQANVLRLEEECRKKQEFVDKSSQLQRALSSLQLTNDKREQSEKKVRTALEGEITDLKLRLTSLNVNQSTQLSQQQSSMSQLGNSGRNGSQGSQRSYQSPPYTPPKYESNSNLTESQLQLQLLQEKLKVSEEQIYHLNSQVAKWENVFSPPLPSASYKQQQQQQPLRTPASVSTPDTPNSWTTNSRGGTPHFFGGNSEKVSLEELNQGGRGANTDLEWKIKDLESRLMEKDAVIRILQTVPPPSSPGTTMYSPMMLNSSGSSSSAVGMLHPSTSLPSYRDSPGYSQSSTLVMSAGCHPQHPISVSMAAMMGDQPSLMYSKGLQQKCESEPPSYANLPLKLRLGGSGSSLVKNSNESLQLGGGGSTGGNSPNISGPGSVSSNSGGITTKSIDDQLKDLDNQLLSKDGVGGSGGGGGLKMQSGLCCIPGFSHPSTATRKGKISQSLLESLATAGPGIGSLAIASLTQAQAPLSSTGFGRKTSLTSSILPPKPPSTYQAQAHGGSRTSSGPPFISPSDQSPILAPLVTTTTVMSLSNSVDSALSDPPTPTGTSSCASHVRGREREGTPATTTCNVFTPATGALKGLPPKPTTGLDSQAGKSRSLERNKYGAPGDVCAGKYTAVMYDGARCRSLDRRELKLANDVTRTNPTTKSSEEKIETSKEKESKKSSVSSKAAFFGQLLTRRSPSPGREKKEKESSTPKMGRRFPFGSKSQSPPQQQQQQQAGGEVAEERMMLDKQGRQSQRSRISSKWNSCNTLEAVEEQSGSESPWTCRKSKGSPKVSKKMSKQMEKDQGTPQHHQQREKDESPAESGSSSNKKWGRIVKSPFGLRYTFGSPRVAAPQDHHLPPQTSSSTSSKQQEK